MTGGQDERKQCLRFLHAVLSEIRTLGLSALTRLRPLTLLQPLTYFLLTLASAGLRRNVTPAEYLSITYVSSTPGLLPTVRRALILSHT